ncbi:unnamed protein product, partial [Ectocarpus sp. 8 AP-2014]
LAPSPICVTDRNTNTKCAYAAQVAASLAHQRRPRQQQSPLNRPICSLPFRHVISRTRQAGKGKAGRDQKPAEPPRTGTNTRAKKFSSQAYAPYPKHTARTIDTAVESTYHVPPRPRIMQN